MASTAPLAPGKSGQLSAFLNFASLAKQQCTAQRAYVPEVSARSKGFSHRVQSFSHDEGPRPLGYAHAKAAAPKRIYNGAVCSLANPDDFSDRPIIMDDPQTKKQSDGGTTRMEHRQKWRTWSPHWVKVTIGRFWDCSGVCILTD